MQVQSEETLRRSIAAATDARARARLRVELAAVVRARDPAAAREELTNAAREAAPTQALTLAAIAMARDERLPPHQRRAAANKLVRICDRLDPILGRGALFTAAMLAVGKARRA